jgi:hypothetical protein
MSDEVSGEVVETCTVWAVYTFPYLRGLYGYGEHSELVIHLIGRGNPEVTFLMDGTEKIDGECVVCDRYAFRGTCPGPEAHTFAQWHIESTRNIWFPVEMGKFEVPADLDHHGRIVETMRLIMQRQRETEPAAQPQK